MPPADQDVVLTKLDAMQVVIDSKLEAHRREQDGIIKWLERLTSTLESQVALTSTLLRVEDRLRTFEISSQKQDDAIDKLNTELTAVKMSNATSGVKIAAIVGTVVMVATAAIGALFTKFVG